MPPVAAQQSVDVLPQAGSLPPQGWPYSLRFVSPSHVDSHYASEAREGEAPAEPLTTHNCIQKQ